MDKTTIVDDDKIKARKQSQDRNLFSRLPAAYAASRKQAQRLLEGCGLSIVEWRTLWDLTEVGPATIRDLAAIQRADHSQLSRALPEMRRKGLVSMQRGERDGRQTIVELTDAGQMAYARAAPIMARRRAALHDAFSRDEMAILVAFLDRLDEFLHLPIERITKERAPE